MDIHFTCPFCDQPMTVDHQGAGADVSCFGCGRSVTIPQPIDTPANPRKPPVIAPVSRPPAPTTVSRSPQPMQVIVMDFEMNFGSMVVFMIKWSLAAIPALFILAAIGLAVLAFFASMGAALK